MLPKNFTRMSAFIFIVISMAACAPFEPAPAAEAQLPPGAVETAVAATLSVAQNQLETMVAATLEAMPTKVAPATPTEMFTPTTEPTPTVTPIAVEPTFTPFPPTPTQPAGFVRTPVKREYACSVFSQKPKDYVVMSPRQDFDMRWTILNTGTNAWTERGTDYKYLRGPKMHKYADIYDLNTHIGPGGKLEIVIDMVAPKEKGTHVAYWGLANGSRHFCQFYIIVIVR